MSPGQITEWQAYQKIRGPLGPQRMDAYVAMILYALMHDPNTKPSDFLPQWRPDPRLANPAEFFEQMMDQMEQPDDHR